MRLRVAEHFGHAGDAKSSVLWPGQVTSTLHVRIDALIYHLLVEEVVSDAISPQNQDIIVLDIVLLINGIVGQVAILATLVREIELVGLLLRTIDLGNAIIITWTQDHVGGVTKVAGLHFSCHGSALNFLLVVDLNNNSCCAASIRICLHTIDEQVLERA